MRYPLLAALLGAVVLTAVFAGCLGAQPDATKTGMTGATKTPVPATTTTLSPSVSTSKLELEVSYSGMWSGAYGTRDAIHSDEGFGNATLDLPSNAPFIQASFQKQETTDEALTIRLLRDGVVVKEASGSAPLAVVTLEATLG
jgi:hypothetical protein